MKKVLLTAMALLTIASTSVFGMYGANSDWIDFLVHGNQFRARMRQFGFVLGNDMIRGTVGFRSENGSLGTIFSPTTVQPDGSTTQKQFLNFVPTVSAGIGYTSDVFSIGVGYNYTYKHDDRFIGTTKNGYGLSIHTPVVTMTAMNDSLRIVVPVQIAAKNGDIAPVNNVGGTDKSKYMGISMDPQIRYYTGIQALNELRLYVYYGMNQYTDQDGTKATGSSFGFEFRPYFGATVGDVTLKPFIKIGYDTALDAKGKVANTIDGKGSTKVSSSSVVTYGTPATGVTGFDSNPWLLRLIPTLGLSANSDIVSLYLEAGIGYKAENTGYKFNNTTGDYGITHSLAWSSYAEIYITPVKDLEWYFEAEIGNYATGSATDATGAPITYLTGGANNVQFNASTGITWYLPALQ